jgi:hypothetical protein
LEGKDTPSLSTLAWKDYGAAEEIRPVWTVVVEYAIILMPAFNIIFSLPVIAVYVSSNVARIFG